MGGPEAHNHLCYQTLVPFLIIGKVNYEVFMNISFFLFCSEDDIYVSIIYHSMSSLNIDSEDAKL